MRCPHETEVATGRSRRSTRSRGSCCCARACGIGVAHTIVELGAVHRLRHRDVSSAPEPLEPDPYDDHALQLAAWRGSALAATLRLVLPVPARRLPTEDAFDLDIEPRGEVGATSADLLVGAAPPRAIPSHRAWGGLFALAWQEARARSYTVMARASPRQQLVERYRSLGVRVEVLGPPRDARGRGAPRRPPRPGGRQGSRLVLSRFHRGRAAPVERRGC